MVRLSFPAYRYEALVTSACLNVHKNSPLTPPLFFLLGLNSAVQFTLIMYKEEGRETELKCVMQTL